MACHLTADFTTICFNTEVNDRQARMEVPFVHYYDIRQLSHEQTRTFREQEMALLENVFVCTQ